MKIDRATGEAITWIDDPSWENDSGFGVGGLIWNGADSLEKPIERLIVTHEHPDHWFGLRAAFSDVSLYTTASTQAFLAQAGAGMLEARTESMGADPTYVPIENVLPEGSETLDGVTYEYRVYQAAEAEEQVVILLPNQGVMLVGDLIYNNFYLILEPGFDNWIAILKELQSLDGYAVVLPGHGQPDDTSVLAENIAYLQRAFVLFAEVDGPEAFQAAMIEQYPDWGARSSGILSSADSIPRQVNSDYRSF